MRDKKSLYQRFTEGPTTLKQTGEHRFQPTTGLFRISLTFVRKKLAGSGIDTVLWDDIIQDAFLAYCSAVEAGRMRAEYGEASIVAFIKKTLENTCVDAIRAKQKEFNQRTWVVPDEVDDEEDKETEEEAWERAAFKSEGKNKIGEVFIDALEPGAWTHQRFKTPEQIYLSTEVGEATREINYLNLLKEHIVKGVPIKEIVAELGWSTNRVRKAVETGKRNYKKAVEVLGYEYSRDREFMSARLSMLYRDLGKGGRMRDGIYPEHLARHNEFTRLQRDHARLYNACYECGSLNKASCVFDFNGRVFCPSCVKKHSPDGPYVPGRDLIWPQVPEDCRWVFDYMLDGINLKILRIWCQSDQSKDYRYGERGVVSQVF